MIHHHHPTIRVVVQGFITIPTSRFPTSTQRIVAASLSNNNNNRGDFLQIAREPRRSSTTTTLFPSTRTRSSADNDETITTDVEDYLFKCTLPQLWDMIQEQNLLQPGLKSKLKRKQDVLNYLLVQQQKQKQGLNQTPPKQNREGSSTQQPHEEAEEESLTSSSSSPLDDYSIPTALQTKLTQHTIQSFLPIQQASFTRIRQGDDVVLQAPTGSGKTLAYVLPLVAQLLEKSKTKPRSSRQTSKTLAATPSILVLVPSRELAKQVGKEFEKYCGSSKQGIVATVHGGVPLERHIYMLQRAPQIVVATPGRLRELYRNNHLEFSHIQTIVVDEADTLLDAIDSPDVQAIWRDVESSVEEKSNNEDDDDDDDSSYQVVLVSATMNNQNVQEFCEDLEIPSSAWIRQVDLEDPPLLPPESIAPPTHTDGKTTPVPATTTTTTTAPLTIHNQPSASKVQHWHVACKSNAMVKVAQDLMTLWKPQLTLVFCASKAQVEQVAGDLAAASGGGATSRIIRVLHGDMVQSARSRTLAMIRASSDQTQTQQILVATDVASRGIDLDVDLVIQLGIPRQSGKEGTYSIDLYTHRAGRTGRIRSNTKNAKRRRVGSNAVVLYDPAVGEGKLIAGLQQEVQEELGVVLQARALPSGKEVIDAAFETTVDNLLDFATEGDNNNDDLTRYFRQRLEAETGIDTKDPNALLDTLSRAMVQLAQGVDPSTMSPHQPKASLLSANPLERTVRVWTKEGTSTTTPALTPPYITQLCKSLGSGKLGRIQICEDGSAIFDLPTKRATKLVQAAISSPHWEEVGMELPMILPSL